MWTIVGSIKAIVKASPTRGMRIQKRHSRRSLLFLSSWPEEFSSRRARVRLMKSLRSKAATIPEARNVVPAKKR